MLAHSCRRGDGLTRIEDAAATTYVLNWMVSAKEGAEDVICENGAEAVVAAMRGHKKAWSGCSIFRREAAKNAVRVPSGPKKRKEKEMGHSRSQHFMLDSRDIESVTRRVGRWGFSKVYPWNGRIQP